MSFPKYPKYKDSGVEWLGEVPEHWGIVQFKRFVDIQNGTDHKEVEQDEGYPVIGSGGAFSFASKYLYDGESVLLGRKGTIDKPLYVNGRFWTVDTMYWTKFRSDVSGRFTYFLALTIPFDFYSTNTALPSMTKGALNSHIVAFPSKEEQENIAAFLDRETAKIDDLIAEQEKLITLLAEKRQAVISHAVTKGLNPKARMKNSGVEWLGEVPEHWEVKRVKHLAVRIGSGKTPLGGSETYVDEGVIFLRSQNIYDDGLRLEDVVFITPEVDESMANSRVHPKDILINITGASIGRSCQVPESLGPANVNQHVCVVRLQENSSSGFVTWVFNSSVIKTQVDFLQGGAAREGLNFEQVGSFAFALPPESEQAEISKYLSSHISQFDLLSADARCAMQTLQERRSSLISAAVTGKIDVRGVQD